MKRLVIIITIALMASLSAQAEVYDFYTITSYTNDGYQSVVNQLSMELVPLTDTSAKLVFENAGLIVSAVEAIYFDTDVPLGVVPLPDGWIYGESPPKLPGEDGISFKSDFYIKTIPPPTQNGIIVDSSLEVVLSYEAGFDILVALNSGEFRVGLHTIGILDTDGRLVTQADIDRYGEDEVGELGDIWSYSESSINIIPEPASLALLVGASSLIVFIRRKFIV